MLGVDIQNIEFFKRVENAAEGANFRNFGHAGASIRKTAQASLVKSDEPSAPGSPPHTRKGAIRRAIVYAADQNGAVIGPTANIVGEAGSAHEFGLNYRGGVFPERPFMWPALEANLDRFADSWEGSIGE